MISRRKLLALLASGAIPGRLLAESLDSPLFAKRLASGELPELSQRLPKNPRVIDLSAMGRKPGHHGGRVRMLIGRQKDIRYIPINSYSRLVGYNVDLDIVPDILASYDIDEGRIFTFHLREGHKWSDGSELTSGDFQYFWNDVILDTDMYKGGPPENLKTNGQVARFEVLDKMTVRYSWDEPNPLFLTELAAPIPRRWHFPQPTCVSFMPDIKQRRSWPNI